MRGFPSRREKEAGFENTIPANLVVKVTRIRKVDWDRET